MPTLSASDYTQYLKFKAASISSIKPSIQTRDNVSTSQSLINATLLASQAALVVTPSTTQTRTLPAVVTDVSTSTVTAARTDVISGVTGGSNVFTYTTSTPHGFTVGSTVTISISGLGLGTLNGNPNGSKTVTVTTSTQFTWPIVGASGSSSGTGSIADRVYYTTSVAHALSAGDTATITGITTFTASDATVLAAPTATTFVLSSSTTGTAVSGQTGTIVGYIYYTTDSAHGLFAQQKNLTITGITGTTAFNLSLATVYAAPTTTVFVVRSGVTGTAVTGKSGVLTLYSFGNPTTVITTNARVSAPPPNIVNHPSALSTVSYAGTSGALGSSRFNRPGGLPTGFKNSQASYSRIPQNAGWSQGGAANI